MLLLGNSMAGYSAAQEEYLVKVKEVPPMELVGREGVCGTVIMLGIVSPLLYVLPGSDTPGGH